MTRLDDFIQAHYIHHEELAQLAQVSALYLARLRSGQSAPTKAVMVRMAMACSWITREKVFVWDLFDRL